MIPIAMAPDDGRFDHLKAIKLGEFPEDVIRSAIKASERAGIRTLSWVRRAVDAQIDRDLAFVPDGKKINGYVYVAGPPDGSKVKIGVSRRPRSRISGIKSSGGVMSIALFYIHGDLLHYLVEQTAHALLSDRSLGWEWFCVSP
jgi:hypothetical protein